MKIKKTKSLISFGRIVNLFIFILFSGAFSWAQTVQTFTSPGTYSWTVPPCVTSITVQVWGAGGGGGAVWSRFDPTQSSVTSDEICTAAGGGGGGGFTTRTYTVVPGQTYTIVVGAGGIGGVINNALASNRAQNGSAGGNSTFSGPATAGPGTLTAFGGSGGGAANILRSCLGGCSGAVHQGNNGTGGAGAGGANGTTTFTGGNGSAGVHSGSTEDRSGAGGGGAGTLANGGNASSTSGGTGGNASGGNGANGIIQPYGSGYLGTNGSNGSTIGGGGGGACGHNRGGNNNSHRTNIGGNGARGEVRIIYTAPASTTPTFDPVSDICSGDPLGPLPTTSLNGISGVWSPAINNTATTTYTFTPDPSECAATASMTIAVNTTPTINTEPQDIAICSSGSGSLTVSASSGPYQWQYYDGSTWSNVTDGIPTGATYTGGTTASLGLSGSSLSCGDYEYRVLVGAASCQAISASAFVSVIRATRIAPTGPQCSGTQLNFDACPAGGVYSWSVVPPSGASASPTSGSGQTFSFTPQNQSGSNQIFTVNASITFMGLTCDQTFSPTIVSTPDAGANGTLDICAGTTVTAADLFGALTGTPQSGGTWSPVLAGAGTYTYTVAATAPCATDATAQVVVSEITAPNAGSNGTLVICQGSTVTAPELFSSLTGTPDAGGTWSPALAGAGTYTYTVTVAGCTDATASVAVTEQAQPNAGSNGTLDICAGTTVTAADLFGALTGAPQSGGTWSPALAGAGTYTYIVAATAPCATDATSTVTVTEQAAPDAGSNGTLDICAGTTVTTADLFGALTGTPDAGGTWSPILAGAGTYTYTVAATAPCATDATAQVVVSEITAPNAGSNGTLVICQGSTVTAPELFSSLTGTPDAGGTWSPALAGAGTYTYTVTVAGCTDATASVAVTEQAQPNAGTNGTLNICEGTTVTAADLFGALTGTPDAGGTWSPALAGAGTYTYTVAATAPCATDATSTVTVTEQAAPDAGSNGTLDICAGTTVTTADLFGVLTGTPQSGGTWSPALAGAGTYTYTVAATAPCATDATAQVVVSEITAPNAGSNGTLVICQGSTVTAPQLFSSLTGTPDAGGTWSPALAGAGTYTYTVTVAGCTDATASVTVTEQAQPNAGTNGTLNICAGTTVTAADLFGALTGTPDAGGTWSPALAGAGTYTYTVAATAPCATDATSTVTVTEQAAPDAGANGTLDICAGTTVTTADLFGVLTGTPQSGGTWSPALAGAGTYTYTVAATAPCATDATAQVILTVSNCEIVIPSGFTPSGDGVNETWELIGLDDKYPNNKVYIYNRWGNLIFESRQGDYMSQPWDGTYEGKPLPVSSFYYMIYTDPEQEGEVIKGTLSILKK